MVDVALTSAVYLSGPAPIILTAGATIAVTDALYLDNTTGTGKLADADTLAESKMAGLALGSSVSGNPVAAAGPGTRVTVNAVLTKGTVYYVSPTAGKLCPYADVLAGDYYTLAAIAESTTVLRILGVALEVTA